MSWTNTMNHRLGLLSNIQYGSVKWNWSFTDHLSISEKVRLVYNQKDEENVRVEGCRLGREDISRCEWFRS